jgi:hypothetical protein
VVGGGAIEATAPFRSNDLGAASACSKNARVAASTLAGSCR